MTTIFDSGILVDAKDFIKLPEDSKIDTVVSQPVLLDFCFSGMGLVAYCPSHSNGWVEESRYVAEFPNVENALDYMVKLVNDLRVVPYRNNASEESDAAMVETHRELVELRKTCKAILSPKDNTCRKVESLVSHLPYLKLGDSPNETNTLEIFSGLYLHLSLGNTGQLLFGPYEGRVGYCIQDLNQYTLDDGMIHKQVIFGEGGTLEEALTTIQNHFLVTESASVKKIPKGWYGALTAMAENFSNEKFLTSTYQRLGRLQFTEGEMYVNPQSESVCVFDSEGIKIMLFKLPKLEDKETQNV